MFYLLKAFQNVDRYQQIPSHLWSISTTVLSGFTHRIIPNSLLNHSNSFCRWMSKFEAKLDADSLIYSPSRCECDSHTINKLAQRCLTATWLDPCESNCTRMHSKVSSDWLPSYIKATWPALKIFKMAGYFLDGPHIIKWVSTSLESISCLCTVIQVKPSHAIYAAKVLWHILYFISIPSVKGLDGSTMKWDTSKLTSLIFSHILLDFQCLKYRSYCLLSEYFVADIWM